MPGDTSTESPAARGLGADSLKEAASALPFSASWRKSAQKAREVVAERAHNPPDHTSAMQRNESEASGGGPSGPRCRARLRFHWDLRGVLRVTRSAFLESPGRHGAERWRPMHKAALGAANE